jgi:hypothetical protein
MFFKAYRSRRSSKSSEKTNTTLQQTTSSDSNTNSASPSTNLKGVVVHTAATEQEECNDYQIFLEQARKEAKKRQDAILTAIEEADRKRRNMNMDPWSRTIGKF